MLTSAGGVLEVCWSSTTPTCSNVRSIQHDPNTTPARSTGTPHRRASPTLPAIGQVVFASPRAPKPVSYTHLTLPTIYSV